MHIFDIVVSSNWILFTLLFYKIINRNVRSLCWICSQLTRELLKLWHWGLSGVFITNFEKIYHKNLLFLFTILNRIFDFYHFRLISKTCSKLAENMIVKGTKVVKEEREFHLLAVLLKNHHWTVLTFYPLITGPLALNFTPLHIARRNNPVPI